MDVNIAINERTFAQAGDNSVHVAQLKFPRVVILGGGAVVSEYYLPAFKTLPFPPVTVVEPSENAVESIRKSYPGVETSIQDFRSFLDFGANTFDAAIVALPNNLHFEATAMCLNLGLHVLCEKPLTLDRDQCFDLAQSAERSRRVLSVGMVRRLIPAVTAMKSAVRAGLIGRVTSIDIEDGSPYAWLSDSGAFFQRDNGGVLADMGIHYLDMIEDLLTAKLFPVSYSDDWHGGVEADCDLRLRSEFGVDVALKLSRLRNLENRITVSGEKGTITIHKGDFESCSWRATDSNVVGQLRPERCFEFGNWAPLFESCFAEQLCRFAAAVEGQEKYMISARQVANTVGLVQWAYHNRESAGMQGGCSSAEEKDCGSFAVTGASGFIGTRLVERLFENGTNHVRALVRTYRTCSPIAKFPVELYKVDILDKADILNRLRGSRYVVHLAYGRDGRYRDRAGATIQGTRNVVEAAIEAQVECVLILSTIYVFGNSCTPETIDETQSYRPIGGEYGKSKAEVEKWCLERAKTSGKTRIVVLNPSCVYGAHGKTYTRLPIDLARHGRFCWVDQGRGLANYTYVDNLVDAILLALSNIRANGNRFIINDGTTTWLEFLKPMLGSCFEQVPSYTQTELRELQPRHSFVGAIGKSLSTPEAVDRFKETKAVSQFMNVLDQWFPSAGKKIRSVRATVSDKGGAGATARKIPPLWVADLFGPQQSTFLSTKAEQILGWKPKIGLEEGQSRSVEYLLWLKLMGSTQDDSK